MNRPRQGLVLLVVLGMLGLFTLLTITYLSVTTQSRVAGRALVRAKMQDRQIDLNPDAVVSKIIAGDANHLSAFYGHSLLEDIYGRDAFEGEFISTSGVLNRPTQLGLVKVQLATNIILNPDPYRLTAGEGTNVSHLSVENDTYTGRLITFLEGPLMNQTFRVLGYLGASAPTGFEYSIAIDLAEAEDKYLEYTVTTGGVSRTLSGTLSELLASNGGNPAFLFTKVPGSSGAGTGYRYLMNDMPFSGFGYGIETDPTHPSFGNLDGGRLVPGANEVTPGTYGPGGESFPIALLPNYDYLKKDHPSNAIGSGQRNAAGPYVEVAGSSNEGFDVADFHDYFLAHIPAPTNLGATVTSGEIIPSFHRPEIINYIANKMAPSGAASLTPQQVIRLVTLVDYACARPLSYVISNGPSTVLLKNSSFKGRTDSYAIPTLEIDLASWPSDQQKLQEWIRALIAGGGAAITSAFDVDNDGDGVAEAVWVDPHLPLTNAPNGRYLKQLSAVTILDLDGRVNLNTAGDLGQNIAIKTGAENKAAGDRTFSRMDPNSSAGVFYPQGLGYGPAEIYLPRLETTTATFAQNILQSRYRNSPGGRFPGQANFNDLIGARLYQREMRIAGTDAYGLRQARRGATAMGTDLLGNPRMTLTNNHFNEFVDDPYESPGMSVLSTDEPFSVWELENLLRRFDRDAQHIDSRIRNQISNTLSLNDAIYRSITTRSVELRYPNAAALAHHTQNYANPNFPMANSSSGLAAVPNNPNRLMTNSRNEGSMLRWIQMLYAERYYNVGASGTPLELADIRELFPLEFRHGLRLNINRPFGNGRDDDNDGMIDERDELATAQNEIYTDGTSIAGTYAITSYPASADPAHASMVSRKMLARQLYCLAQLLVAPDYPFAGISGPSAAYDRLRARELAQWAVNVVDFRDTDSAMTRFEYEDTPFTVDPGDSSVWESEPGEIVWGLEFPEVVLSETLAFHDLRVKDTAQDNVADNSNAQSPPNPITTTDPATTTDPDPEKRDLDFDQYRIPEGSLFLELYCPRSPNSPLRPTVTGDDKLGVASTDLYNASNQRLNLSKLAPPSATYGTQPVFRIGITAPTNGIAPPQAQLATQNFDELTKLTNQVSETARQTSVNNSSGLVANIDDLSGGGPPALNFDRMIWFQTALPAADQYVPDLQNCETQAGGNTETQHRIFLNGGAPAGTTVNLHGGGYLVIGPRPTTYIGSVNSTGGGYVPSPQSIVLTPPLHGSWQGRVQLTDLNGVTRDNSSWPSGSTWPDFSGWTNAPQPAVMIATAAPPSTWGGAVPSYLPYGRLGLSASEPIGVAGYYLLPTHSVAPGAPDDGYGNGSGNTFPDLPFDYQEVPDAAGNTQLPPKPLCLEAQNNRHLEGTYLNYRMVYLQRLADPDQAYHPNFNPYITIDWMPLDLTVFNGEAPRTNNPKEPSVTPAATAVAFQSRYKDGARVIDAVSTTTVVPPPTTPTRLSLLGGGTAIETGVSMFSSSTCQFHASTAGTASGDQPYFAHLLGTVNPNSVVPTDTLSSATLGYLNTGRYYSIGGVSGWDGFEPHAINGSEPAIAYRWAPSGPQGSLTWLDRPFASPYEIMLVPRVGPGQLGQLYTTPKTPTPSSPPHRYERTLTNYLPPFGYLMDFFTSEDPNYTAGQYWQRPNTTTAITDTGSNLCLLLELIETPTPYPDAERWINPNLVAKGNALNQIRNLTELYQAPFNFFSRYRAPGKVNLNTLAEQAVFDAIEGNFDKDARFLNAVRTTKFNKFLEERRGYTPSPGSFFSAPGDANPNLNPAIPTRFARPYRSGFTTNMEVLGNNLNRDRAVHRGLLRAQTTGFGTNPPTRSKDDLKFAVDSNSYSGAVKTRTDAEFLRVPFADMQRMMRLPNLVTNQSNVFAVWVTLGLFEYDEVEGIGEEYVSPSGRSERATAFYIIDRSIPVACSPGRQLNSENTILLRRRIPR